LMQCNKYLAQTLDMPLTALIIQIVRCNINAPENLSLTF
jgi:hypothetical protein